MNNIFRPDHAIEPLQHTCKRRLEVRGRIQNSLRDTCRRVESTWRDLENLLRVGRQRTLPLALQKIQVDVTSSLSKLGHARFLIGHHNWHLLDLLIGSPEVAHHAKPLFFGVAIASLAYAACISRKRCPKAAKEAMHAANEAVLMGS